MDEFLRQRKLTQAVIDRLSNDKINCEAIVCMTDDQLRRYIPAYGDRVALVAFSKSQSQQSDTASGKGLSERLKRFSKKHLTGNTHAKRLNRRIELGWMHFYSQTGTYKQVRSRNGGGTRSLAVEKTLTVTDLSSAAKAQFFPNGISKLGMDSDFNFEIRDFKGDKLRNDKKIEDIFQEANLKILRLYIYTKKIDATTAGNKDGLGISDELESSDEELRQSMLNTPLQNTNNDASTSRSTGEEESPCSIALVAEHHLETSTQKITSVEEPGPSCISDGLDTGTPERDVIDVIDSEDEEIQEAIENSLLDIEMKEPSIPQLCDLQEALKTLNAKTVESESRTKLIVIRSNILESTLRSLDRKNINLQAKLYIKFSGEIGEDYGGPRREFFRLAIQAVHQSGFFEGPEENKIFRHDLGLLEKKHYRLVGRLVALSLTQEGPGLNSLNKQLFNLMIGQDVDLSDVQLTMIPEELKELIRQLEDADTDEKKDVFLSNHAENLIDQGFANPYTMLQDKKAEMKHVLKKNYLYYRVSSEITQFKNGMNDVGKTWDFVQEHADVFEPLFCQKQKALSADEMSKLFSFKHSEEGTNDRTLENVTVYAWEMFLQSVEEEDVPVTFAELLIFSTGSDEIPPCGFSKTIDILFYNQEKGECRLPHVSTCGLQMWLPRIQKPDSFSTLLVKAISESGGFLKV